MHVRPATFLDAQNIAHIHVETWRVAYKELMPATVLAALDIRWRAKFWEERLRPHSKNVFVAEEQGKLLGFCDLEVCRDKDVCEKGVGEIVAIYVEPENWRKGVGRQLMENALAAAKRDGYQTVVLWTLKANQPAHRFYDRLEFVPDGATKKGKLSDGSEIDQIRFRIDF